jgi:[protein-PII] uridylyltransferase
MQFNQYHSYTVDEHTLKTIDEVVSFADDETPVGSAYDSVRHKATLHISLILHDIGKGRDGDHSIIGEQIAEEVAIRLQTPENKKRMMMFLVRHHLVMPDLAFRRDITDQTLLVDFARLVGAPELLRMLYVLSVADLKAVGPEVWTDWKGDLMADLYNRTMLILSGRPFNHLERERIALLREYVRTSMVSSSAEISRVGNTNSAQDDLPEWIDRQLDALPPFYLMTEEPDRIAQDLGSIKQLSETDVIVEGAYDSETDTVTYRIIASSRYEPGSFHKLTGVLSGLRMDIHTAHSCTTADGTLIGSFRVSDNDFVGRVGEYRISEVCTALSDVLTGKLDVDSIFRRSGLFRLKKKDRIIAPVAPRVSIDNDCSEKHTVIDVFATDNPGLLYTLALTLYRHGLSVELTRIATNVDQVVDVFYVVDSDSGRKVETHERLHGLYEALMHELTELQTHLDSA